MLCVLFFFLVLKFPPTTTCTYGNSVWETRSLIPETCILIDKDWKNTLSRDVLLRTALLLKLLTKLQKKLWGRPAHLSLIIWEIRRATNVYWSFPLKEPWTKHNILSKSHLITLSKFPVKQQEVCHMEKADPLLSTQ